MTKVIARVHPVHLTNVDWAPGGRQPSDQTSQLGLWVCRKLAAIIHIHHRHCYYYSAHRLILIYRPTKGGRLSRPKHCSKGAHPMKPNRPPLCTLCKVCMRCGLITKTSCYSGLAAGGHMASAPLWVMLRISTTGKSVYVQVWPSQRCPFPWGSRLPPNSWFLAPVWVHSPNGISTGSAVLTENTAVFSRQIDTTRYIAFVQHRKTWRRKGANDCTDKQSVY